MSSFVSPLVVSPLPGGRRWRLELPFRYHVKSRYSKEVIAVPAKFITDFASIETAGFVSMALLLLYLVLTYIFTLPYWLSIVFLAPAIIYLALPKWAKNSKPSVLHDWLYYNHIYNRAMSDLIFYEAMLVAFRHHKSGRIIAWIEYWAVRIAGWLAWRN